MSEVLDIRTCMSSPAAETLLHLRWETSAQASSLCLKQPRHSPQGAVEKHVYAVRGEDQQTPTRIHTPVINRCLPSPTPRHDECCPHEGAAALLSWGGALDAGWGPSENMTGVCTGREQHGARIGPSSFGIWPSHGRPVCFSKRLLSVGLICAEAHPLGLGERCTNVWRRRLAPRGNAGGPLASDLLPTAWDVSFENSAACRSSQIITDVRARVWLRNLLFERLLSVRTPEPLPSPLQDITRTIQEIRGVVGDALQAAGKNLPTALPSAFQITGLNRRLGDRSVDDEGDFSPSAIAAAQLRNDYRARGYNDQCFFHQRYAPKPIEMVAIFGGRERS
jgi:hypothetical protein